MHWKHGVQVLTEKQTRTAAESCACAAPPVRTMLAVCGANDGDFFLERSRNGRIARRARHPVFPVATPTPETRVDIATVIRRSRHRHSVAGLEFAGVRCSSRLPF